MPDDEIDLKAQHTHTLNQKLSALGWGVFFIWVGIAFLTGIGWGVGLLGVGIIILGGEMARKYLGLPVNWFWMTMGGLFVVWGACELLNIKFSNAFLPILSIAVGVAILVFVLRPRKSP